MCGDELFKSMSLYNLIRECASVGICKAKRNLVSICNAASTLIVITINFGFVMTACLASTTLLHSAHHVVY